MTKISLYNIDDNITANDKWIGSDVDTQNRTKNFTPKKLANYFNENQVINIGTSIQYKYYTLDPLESRPVGTLTFETEIGATVPFSTVTTFLLSKYTTKQNDVSQFLPLLVGTRSLLYKSSDINSFGLYTIDSIDPYITDPNFWVVTLTYMTGNGSLEEDKDYMISLVDFSDGDIPTKTSDLINDGEDGIHPFITAGDVVVPTLDAVLTEGNVSTQDAYLGRVHLFNTHLLSGYSSIGGEKDRVNFYNTASTPLGYFGLNSIMLKYGAYEGIIHSDYLTASRDYYLPNQSGTIALTSDIPGNQNLQSVTDEGNTTTNQIIVESGQYKNSVGIADVRTENTTSGASIYLSTDDGIVISNASGSGRIKADNIALGNNPDFQLPNKSGTFTIATIDDIPTLTSELTNDGANGVDPFITALDIPTNGLPAGGTAGQILTKVDATDYNATWQENFADWTSVVKHTVKNNGLSGTITKGTAVYVTGSNGTNMLVGRASNVSEATSSKTMGLMQSDITTTGGTQTGFVITEGLIQGLNTAGQTAGDPVWLGVNGALIYGLTNKPYAPAHLVFIGIVTKISAGNGEIFVKVQNGFELKEIHDVDLITTTPINGHLLGFDGTLWVNKTIAGWLGYTPISGTGTINYLPKFTGTSVLGNSIIYDTGSRIGIGGTGINLRFEVFSNQNYANPVLGSKITGTTSILSSNGLYGLYTGVSDTGSTWIQSQRNDTATAYNINLQPSGGNVGIGTLAPAAKLDVVGGDALINGVKVGRGAGNIDTNTVVGNLALNNNVISGSNTSIGYTSMLNVTSGTSNVVIGSAASRYIADKSTAVTVLNSSIMLGYRTSPLADSQTNQIVIGYDATGLGSNTVVLGNSSILTTALRGNVGIGTTAPTAKLQVNAPGALSTDIAFKIRNSADTRNFLVVNGAGDVYNNGAGGINTSTIFGENSGRNSSGGNNTFFGNSAGFSATSGGSNTAIGSNSLASNTTGVSNTAIGVYTLLNIIGNNNIGIGFNTGRYIADGATSLTTSGESIFIGNTSRPNSNGESNQIVIGHNAIGLGSNTVVLGNSSILTTALRGNIGIGTTAPTAKLQVNAPGALSTDIAFKIRNSADTSDIIRANGVGDVFIGLGAGIINTGLGNIFIGNEAGRSNTTGNSNSFVGVSAGRDNIIGIQNAFFGASAGAANTGSSNSFVGFYSGLNNTSGSDNTFIGTTSGFGNTTGSSNVLIGRNSGRYIANKSTAATITNNSILIGWRTSPLADSQINQIVIGHDATGLGSNTVVLGNSSIITTALTGNVGIGTTAPAAKLQVNAPGALSTDLAFKIRNSADTLDLVTVNGLGTLIGKGFQGTYFYAGTTYYDNARIYIGSTSNAKFQTFTSGFSIEQGALTTIAPTAIFELKSTTQGFLPPRMTNAERLLILTPAVGLCVYCTDVVEGLYINKSTGWTYIG